MLVDPRRLGRVRLDPPVEALGPDAQAITPAQFRAAFGRGTAPVKARLLDQDVIAGIGNLLADQILWLARINPARPVDELTRPETDRLLRALRRTVNAAVGGGGVHTLSVIPFRRPEAACPRCGVRWRAARSAAAPPGGARANRTDRKRGRDRRPQEWTTCHRSRCPARSRTTLAHSSPAPWLAQLTTATLTGSSRHGPFRRKALIPNIRCAQPACWRPTAAFSIVGSSSSTMSPPAERDEAVLAGHPRNQARLRGPGWKRFVQVKATPTAQMTGCRISSRVGPLATGCRRASGGRGTTRPFGLMLLTFPNGRG